MKSIQRLQSAVHFGKRMVSGGATSQPADFLGRHIFSVSRWKNIDLCILIAGSVFIIPFLFSNQTADPFLSPRFLALGGLCSCLFVFAFINTFLPAQGRIQDVFHDPVFIWMTLYLAVCLISLNMAVNAGEGITHWLKSFLCVAFTYGTLLTLGREPGRVHWLTKSIILSGIAFAAVGVIQWGLPGILKIPGHFDVFGTMGNKNLYASALFLYLPFTLFGILQYQGVWRHAAVAASLLVGVGLLITRTRSVWLAIVLAGMVVALTTPVGMRMRANLASGCAGFRKYLPTYGHGRLCMAVAVVLSGIILASGHYSLTTDLFSTASLKDRRFLWELTTEMVKDQPVRGVGLGQWKLRYPEYGRIDRQFQVDGTNFEVVFQRPHNDYLWVLAETGLPGLICVLLFYFILIRRCYTIIRLADDPGAGRLAACMLFGMLGFMVISFFSFPRERIFHNVFLGLISAMILLTAFQANGGFLEKAPRMNRYIFVFILGLCTLCAVVGHSRYRSDMHTRNALQASASGHDGMAITQLNLGETWLTTLDPTSTPLAWHRAMAHYRSGNMELAEADFIKACKAHPFHIHSLNNAAVSQGLAGNRAVAGHYRARVEKLTSVPLER